MTEVDRIFPKLQHPVDPSGADNAENLAARPILDRTQAREYVRRAVRDGVLKPSDIESAKLEEPRLLFVPFWRVDVSVDGFHVDLGRVTVGGGAGGLRIPIPTGGSRHKDAVVMIAARTMFPYEAKLPSWMSGKLDGVAPLEIGLAELTASANIPKDELESAEVVDADVTKEEATRVAAKMVVRATSPQNALISKYEPTIKSALFCKYPVYYARYTYEGVASRGGGEEFYVCVSARTGKALSAHHPSLVRAAAEKFRKLLTFGR